MLTRRMMTGVLIAGSAGATLAALGLNVSAQTAKVFSGSSDAINGYDPVAYFTQKKPVQGDPSITSMWNGTKWRFSSAENKAKFDADPAKYAPQYGGYCAYAVSQGYTAKTDPDAWSIVDGKLYLNYSKSVRSTWEKDKPGYISKADANWPKVLN